MLLMAGDYQVTSVNVPAFNLPYRVDVSKEPGWMFRIEAGSASYIGHLVIEAERNTSSVSVRLSNRLAAELTAVRQASVSLPGLPSLVSGHGHRDDFLLWLESASR